MTSRQLYEACLIEMNKVQAPSLILEDFNYLINKAVYQYIDKRYNIYDINQQTTDDIRVLKATSILTPILTDQSMFPGNFYGAVYEVDLPSDYFHILNCICNYKVNQNFKCYNANSNIQFAAKRLTSDMWSQVINNFYTRPTYRNPYYYIHNVNTSAINPTNPYNNRKGTDINLNITANTKKGVISKLTSASITLYNLALTGFSCNSGDYSNATIGNNNTLTLGVANLYNCAFTTTTANITTLKTNGIVFSNNGTISGANTVFSDVNIVITNTTLILPANSYTIENMESGLPKTILLSNNSESDLVEKTAEYRYGNVSNVRLEIRYGKDNTLFELTNIFIDYLKTPQYIRLTPEQIDTTADTSQIIEFPDYVCQEIIKEMVLLLMENSSDQRLQTFPAINQAIPSQTNQQ